jgi:hypothetical protein
MAIDADDIVGAASSAGTASCIEFAATVEGAGTEPSLIEGNLPLGLFLLVLESCRLQPATLILPKSAQYANNTGRVHLFFPSRIQKITQSHGSRFLRHQRVQNPTIVPTMRTVPT